MPDPRREPFPDETQLDPESPNRLNRLELERRAREPGAQPASKPASQAREAIDERRDGESSR